jgi:3-methyladenine DNA glycosylase AlkD
MASSKQSVAEFHRAIRAALAPLADVRLAAGMRAYMRGRFEYLGIQTPVRRAAITPLIKAFKPADAAGLRKAADGLWKMREREYQYVAVDLLARYHAVLSLDDLPWLLGLVQSKSWWDSVDALLKAVGPVVRRAGIKLHQLGLRDEVDTARLFRYAELLAAEKELFIRKAIGWALRDYAWHDWRAVDRFLKTTQIELSGLTVREARKNFAALSQRSSDNSRLTRRLRKP